MSTEGLKSFPQSGEAPAAVNVDEGFFRTSPRDKTWQDSWTSCIAPASIIDNRRLVFHLPKMDGDLYPQLGELRLKLSVRLTDKDGNAPPDNFSVAPINNVGNSIINSLTLSLNGTTVMSCASGLYPFWSYISALLNNTDDRKKSLLQLAGYYEDSVDSWDSLVEPSGFEERRRLFGNYALSTGPPGTGKFIYNANKIVTFYVPLNTEFVSPTPMLNRVGGSLEMTLNPPGFYLQCEPKDIAACVAKQYAFQVTGAELLVRVREMNPQLSLNLEARIKEAPIEYNNCRMDLKKFLIPANTQSFTTDQLKQNAVCPDRLLFFMIPAYALDDDYGVSVLRSTPFIMDKYKTPAEKKEALRHASFLSRIKLSINNQSLESNNNYVNEEDLVSEKFSYERSEHGVGMTLHEYAMGKFFVMYDLTKAKRAALSGNIRQEVKTGTLKLDLGFNKQLPVNVYLMVLSEFHSKVTVTPNRAIYYKYLD